MPPILSPLLHRSRAAVLALLLVVLPLQGVAQLVAGVQGHRHVHASAGVLLSGLIRPLQAALDRLHAVQDPALLAASRGGTDGWHAHGGLLHRHTQAIHDAVDVGDAGDDAGQGGVTVFIAWLPTPPCWLRGPASAHPAAPAIDWRDRVIAPPLAPPRA